MSKDITGGCCCGSVTFSLEDDFKRFYFCHCQQCRKLTGSAHAANLFTGPGNIRWTKGEQTVSRYDHPERAFSKAFCSHCGSALPCVSQSGKFLIVPAGSLDQAPAKAVDAQLFCKEQAPWYEAGVAAVKLPGFPG
ncbi:GFA family protein [Gallaecimonas xiamenensis]|uniref:Glutathione-dependent formaldehyde-activating protein n=1 Tax=Gallaecimonas xiamenensis 3-C-1 TaxID=745411 RepID=K2IXC8_9GAMM|nr:GFA family protein [Gallaecimonas xiamenensis]EKE67533.1 glutathione-dependent formaldehyde-activating protein [Gallaecimonas xiamenensis 3-C-1]